MAGSIGVLERSIRFPRFIEDAADLATAAVVTVFLCGRFFLLWAIVLGLPSTWLMLTGGAFRPSIAAVSSSRWSDGLLPFAVSTGLEPFAFGIALLYLRARAASITPDVLGMAAVAARRYLPGLAAVLLVNTCSSVLDIVARRPIDFAAEVYGWPGYAGYLFSWIPGAAVHACLLTAIPRIMLDGYGPIRAISRAWSDVRTDVPLVFTAWTFLLGVALAANTVFSIPNVLAERQACLLDISLQPAFCSVWWRGAFLWTRLVAAAPFVTLAFLVQRRTTTRQS